MPHCVFSPNNKISGGAAFVKLTNDNDIMVSIFKQVANNPNKVGNFDFKNGVNVKFSSDEVGGILRAVRTNGNFNFYHTSEKEGQKTVSKGSFNHYNVKGNDGKEKEGFGLTVDKNGDVRKVGYSVGAAEVLAQFLKYCLTFEFESILKEDEKRDKEYLDKKNTAQKPTTPTKKVVQKPELVDEDSSLEDPTVEESPKETPVDADESW